AMFYQYHPETVQLSAVNHRSFRQFPVYGRLLQPFLLLRSQLVPDRKIFGNFHAAFLPSCQLAQDWIQSMDLNETSISSIPMDKLCSQKNHKLISTRLLT